jgi:hypothetical protein
MRDAMPKVAAFVDELRDVFGRGEVNAVIREGLRPDCEPRDRFFASEGGEQLGRPLVIASEVSVSRMVLGPQVVSKKRGRE